MIYYRQYNEVYNSNYITTNWETESVGTIHKSNYSVDYSDISGTPTIPSGNSTIDWTTSQENKTIHKDNYSVDYSDITDSPTGILSSDNSLWVNPYDTNDDGELLSEIEPINTYNNRLLSERMVRLSFDNDWLTTTQEELNSQFGNNTYARSSVIQLGQLITSKYLHGGDPFEPDYNGILDNFLDTESLDELIYRRSTMNISSNLNNNATHLTYETNSSGYPKFNNTIKFGVYGTTNGNNAVNANHYFRNHGDMNFIDNLNDDDLFIIPNYIHYGETLVPMDSSTDVQTVNSFFPSNISDGHSDVTYDGLGAAFKTMSMGDGKHTNHPSEIWFDYVATLADIPDSASDIRYKENINNLIGSVLEKISNLNVFKFKWKERDGIQKDETINIGFSAQQLEEAFPEVVFEKNNVKKIQMVGFSSLLLKAIQELKAENDNLKDKLNKIYEHLGIN